MDTESFEAKPVKPSTELIQARRTRRHYPPQFKQQIIEEVLAGRESVSVIARRYDINANLVFKWKRQYQRQHSDVIAGTKLLPILDDHGFDVDGIDDDELVELMKDCAAGKINESGLYDAIFTHLTHKAI